MSDEQVPSLEEITEANRTASEEQGTGSVESADSNNREGAIPEKFAKANKYDVVKSYQELESKHGAMTSEMAQLKRDQEALQSRLAAMDTFQQPQREPVQQEPTRNPADIIREKYEDDPAGAIAEAFSTYEKRVNASVQNAVGSVSREQALDIYNQKLTSDEDFKRRQQTMAELSREFGPMIAKEFQNSPRLVKLLDLASKGADLGYYTKQATDQAKKDGLSSREEKRQAYSESSTPESQESFNPWKVSMAELKARAEQDLREKKE